MNVHGPIPFPEEFPLRAYRDRTIAMLRRYSRAAVETGRLPSLLGREFFRARVTSYTLHTLEDAVIFVFDVERCLAELTRTERTLIARLVLQEYSQRETARLMGCPKRTLQRMFPDAVDHLTEIMLERGLLSPSILVPRRHRRLHLVPPWGGDTTATDSPAPTQARVVFPTRPISIEACQEPENGVFAATA